MRFLKNLVSHEALEGKPWEFSGGQLAAPEVRKNKKVRDKWISDPTTEYHVFSTWEGLNENQRIIRKGEDGEGNPPMFCYGFTADYDAVMSADEVASGFERLSPFLPNYYSPSLSGKCHLVWRFEKPVKVGSFELAEEFLRHIAAKLRLKDALPAFDEGFFDPCKYYTNGANWFETNEQPISYATAIGWLVMASTKVKYQAMGYNVPLSVVKTELDKDPRFVEQWAGIDFVVGAAGPTWWVEGSESPKSAIVKESGMYTFSSHAPRDFYSWGDLIGWSFVEQYRARHIGNAVDGIYFDGRQFWREINRGDWKPFSKDDILSFLRVVRGLSDKVAKGDNASELDLAYQHLIDHNNIEGAAPFVFKPNGAITVHSKPFLNVHTSRVLRPVSHKVEWGHPDHFPFISSFFGNPTTQGLPESEKCFFKGGRQPLDTFISWLSHFYKSAHDLNLASGHNIFISGPVNVGKTLLNRGIIGGLMNGYREAKEYLMGEDSFGAELFSVAHWVVDDGTMSTSLAAHRRWGEMVKRMAANKTFRYHEKFRTVLMVDWQGRVVITLNSDEESARLLPDIEGSILDKISLFRSTDVATVSFLSEVDMRAILEKELPYFARFLLDWETPEHCLLRRPDGTVDYRFGGITPWHDETMIQRANQSARTAGFAEIIEDWREEYFKTLNESAPLDKKKWTWTGTAFQLRKHICINPGAQDAMRGTDPGELGRLLSQLKAKGYPITSEDKEDHIRYWTIAARGHEREIQKNA